MRPLLSIALALSGAPLLAQSRSHINFVAPPPSQNCPVALTARHSPQGAMEQVRRSSPHPELGYSITFTPANARSITQARLTLHGISGAHLLPAETAGSSSATEEFTVAPAENSGPRFESIVYARKLTGVQLIELDELTFADGTRWQKSSNSVCLVAPNGLMLVAAQAKP